MSSGTTVVKSRATHKYITYDGPNSVSATASDSDSSELISKYYSCAVLATDEFQNLYILLMNNIAICVESI